MANLPPPSITLPPVDTKVDTRLDLITKINLDRKKNGEPELPLPEDFANPEEPLRIEVEALLKRVINPKATKGVRNKERREIVKGYMEKNYPENKGLRTKVLADLESYPMWEPEDA